MKFSEIKKIPNAHYEIDVSWESLEDNLDRYRRLDSFDYDPEFQRDHVWTKDQQIKFVEFILMDGSSGRDIYFNCPGWMSTYEGPMTLVDGKQRLTAALKFLGDDLPVFGHAFYSDFEDRLSLSISFRFHINNICNYDELLAWYISLNSGVAHTEEELERVRNLIGA